MAQTRYMLVLYVCILAMARQVSWAMEIESIMLNSGYKMPIIGLGTWQTDPVDVERAVTVALENGYTHIDTAFLYMNEEAIGKSLKKYFDQGGKREDLFITTKLPMFGNRASEVDKFLTLSLEALGLEYVDMYLIHVPVGLMREGEDNWNLVWNEDGTIAIDETTDHIATWKEMEKQVRAGRIRSIGLSNFNESQVQNVINNAEIKPSNLQIELHAYHQQKPLREFCAKQEIAVTAYSTLGSIGSEAYFTADETIRSLPILLKHSTVLKIAQNHNKTPAQILLRHAVQNGIIVIPKSSKPNRIKENIDIFDFELTRDEMKQMDDLDRGENGKFFDFGVFKGLDRHPQFPFSTVKKN